MNSLASVKLVVHMNLYWPRQMFCFLALNCDHAALKLEYVITGVVYNVDENYDFVLSREYTWNVKNKATKGYEEMYFFLERGGQFCYNELETRVRLTKRRKVGKAGQDFLP